VSIVVRKIRKARWNIHPDISWLDPNDVQADTLLDLKTENNQLSVYFLDDAAALDQLAAALASTCDNIANFDYVLFSQEILSEIGINVAKATGDTPDDTINSWHRHLSEISATKLVQLAKEARARGTIDRLSHKTVHKLVARGMVTNQLDRTRMKLKAEAIYKLEELIKSGTLGL
jgi:hypothetical protein